MRSYLVSFILLSLGLQHLHANDWHYKYDIAAFVWPAYQPDKRFEDIGVFKDGKGECPSLGIYRQVRSQVVAKKNRSGGVPRGERIYLRLVLV